MDKNKLWKWLLLGLLILWSITLVIPPFDRVDDSGAVVARGKVRLGIDLKGGSSFLLEVDADDVRRKLVEREAKIETEDDVSDAMLREEIKHVQEVAVEVIRGRIDGLGIAEPEIYPEGDRRIVVRLPGADAETRADARSQMSKDAVLDFKLVHEESAAWANELVASDQIPKGYKLAGQDGAGYYFVRDFAVPDSTLGRAFREKLKRFGNKRGADFMLMKDSHSDGSTIYRPYFIEVRSRLGGDRIKTARDDRNPQNGAIEIQLEFDSVGKNEFGKLTEQFARTESRPGRYLAIILDEQLYSAPHLNEPIYGGVATISGSFSAREAKQLVNVLRAGSLPGRVEVVDERTVDPTLGQDSIDSGMRAIAWGAALVLIFMAIYYWLPGVIANVSLLFVLLLLPLGMMLSAGFLGVISGALEGGSVGLPTLTLYGIAGIVLTVGMAVDANVLTFERMREEWQVGKSVSGTINAGYDKAFSTILDANVTTLLVAVILFWTGSGPIRGFAVTLTAGILVSMFIVLVITRLFFNTLADAGLLKSIRMFSIKALQNAKINFLGYRKTAGIASVVVILVTWAVFLAKPEKNLGVDFTGGSVVTFKYDQMSDVEVVRAALAEVGFGTAGVSYQQGISNEAEILEVKVGASGDDVLPVIEAIQQLDGNYRVDGNTSVGTQVGDELRNKGIRAIVFALIGIIIYISIRFEFAFAMGAITALVHDVLITIGIYCALGYELNLPIVAALLTIVGYSVNDTIVVFDRIREDLGLVKGKSYLEIANLSINQTLSRTLLTSVTTLLTVVALVLMGGGAVHDFAMALLIGIVVGTYSSIFIATPVVLFWHVEEKIG